MKHDQNFPIGGNHRQPADLVALVQMHARIRPDSLAYVFLENGEREGPRLTFADLDRRARAIAAHLQRHVPRNARALLLFSPGLDYIEAFFGCLYAGVIAVPAYPPSGRHLRRLHSILKDAEPSAILTTDALRARLAPESGIDPGVVWHASDAMDSSDAQDWRPLDVDPGDIAFLQYTSGSTGDPRGVMVSHGNLIANEALIKESFHHSETSTLVGWLPLYHDMGLIGNILQPLYVGATSYLMSPMAFLEKPVRWLAAISKYQARTSGGPNFGYDLCVRKITTEEKRDLDLSEWRIAFSGAEPVRAVTLDRFTKAFAVCGFRPQSFYPCYGLAEATLVASAPADTRETPIRVLGRKSLEQHRAVTGGEDGLHVVGCGHAWPSHDIRIVEPASGNPCADGEIGEIWLAGPSVAKGYWRRNRETKAVFDARLNGDPARSFLRTGDLGFLDKGELYVTGRLKDLIIIGGRNYYPHDIESAIEDAAPGVRPGCTTVVQMTDAETESYIVFAEPGRAGSGAIRNGGGTHLIEAIRAALADAIDVAPRDIVLLKSGSTPKTSSGKTRRAECRRAFLANEFHILARAGDTVEREPQPRSLISQNTEPLLRLALAQLPPPQRAPIIARLLTTEAAKLLRVAESAIDPNTPISRSGLDSLKAMELRHRIEAALGVAPPLALLFSDATFVEAAGTIGSLEAEPLSSTPEIDHRLSFSQQAMWTAHHLDSGSIIYNLHLALEVPPIDVEKFEASLEKTFAQHEQLRTLYRDVEGGVESIVLAPLDGASMLDIVDARGRDAGELQTDFARRAAEPFNLGAQPPLRVTLYLGDASHTLLFVAHHIAVDFWSLLLFITELDARYGDGAPPTTSARYGAFTARQRNYLETPRADADWRYWRDRLGGELPMLQLPYDFPRRRTQSYAGASKPLRLDAELTAALRSLARSEGVSLFSLLLTAYFILLHRHTGQRELVIGAPTSGRLDADFAHTIGNFVNPVAIRATLDPRETARQALRRIHARVREALEHQEFPFSLIVERLSPKRDGDAWPIYQTTFVLQKAQSDFSGDLAVLALGEDTGPLALFGDAAQAVGIRDRVENFDLKLVTAVYGDGLLASFQYRTQRFSEATIERMTRQYRRLLEALVADPECRVDALPLMDDLERQTSIDGWNRTAIAGMREKTVAQRFEVHAERAPDAEAILFKEQRLTYGELNRRANRLAHHLRAKGVGPEAIVAVCLDRSPELLVCLLGVMKAGAAYLPLDHALPAERLRLMIDDAAPALVVTQTSLAELLPRSVGVLCVDEGVSLAQEPDDDPEIVTSAGNLAYVLFTSGSTGRPKAVAIEHRALSNCVAHFADRLRIEPTDRWLSVTTISFDIAALELFAPLTRGAAVILTDLAGRLDPCCLASEIAERNVTIMQATPSLWAALLDSGWGGSMQMTALIGGEHVSQSLARKLATHTKRALNVYGPTETTIWSSGCDIGLRGGDLGAPIANTQVHVVSGALEIEPVGIAGEAVIGGVGLARGYLGRPDLTAQQFVPDPFGPPGARLYRTGDLVRRRLDGGLSYLGRIDQQIKVRGFRIEPGEIESALLSVAGVAAAVVVTQRDSLEHARLDAYVSAASGQRLDAAELRAALARQLPDYMLPNAIVILDALPLNANGKIDRKALPSPEETAPLPEAFTAPVTPTEKAIAEVWKDIFGSDRIGALDNFFDLGGDSIRAIQITSRLRRLGYGLTPRLIFQQPTIRELAESLAAHRFDGPGEYASATNGDIEPYSLSDLDARELDAIRAEHGDAEDIYRLTPLQEGMLLHSLAQEGSGVYHLQERYHFRGALNVEAFFNAWRSVVVRHANLRTSFHLDSLGQPYQFVHSKVELPCTYIDLSSLPPERQTREIEHLLAQSRAQGFDLTRAPLLRIHLAKLTPDLHLCVRDFHHIILDDWCTSPLMLDVRNHYVATIQDSCPPMAPAPQFRDYIAWLRGKDTAAAQSFWKSYLEGFTDPTPLVIAKAAESTAASAVDDVFAEIPREESATLEALAREHRLTVNTFVQAAVGLLLCRYAGTQEALFGVTVAGRPADLPTCDQTLGLFINALPLRVAVAPDQAVLDWLKALLADNVDMRQHEFLSQPMIQRSSEISRDDALFFQHLLTFENAPIDQSLLDDRSIFDISLAGLRVHTNYPITFVAIPGEKLALRITYDRDRFDPADMQRMIRHWRLLILELTRNLDGVIGDLAPLDEQELREVTIDFNQTARDYGAPLDLVARFEAQVEANGSVIAAACCGQALTFAALNARANRLAHTLIEDGYGDGDVVAIFEDRGLDFLTSILAIFKCGAAYLPIDPAYPDGRIAAVLEEAQPAAVLCGGPHLARAKHLAPARSRDTRILDRRKLEGNSSNVGNPPRRHTPKSAAFVIYTSGSTGKPKGAVVEHRGMLNNLITKVPTLGLTPSDVIAQTASQCFDISVWQFLLGLAIGARVEILPDDVSRDPERLIEAIERCGITILESVPVHDPRASRCGQEKFTQPTSLADPCGEAFTPELCRRTMTEHPSLRLLNAYGPAECSDDVTYYPITEAPAGNELSTPIGRPVDNCQIYVLDRWLEPTPIGAPGEICVAGVQVGRGYLHRPDLTANVFRPNPFGPPGSLLYRTGDLGRWHVDGVLDFLGRVDHQVKIRGHRIEPGEIEACLVTHPSIAEACVLPREIGKGSYQLVAYVVGNERDPSILRAFLARALPDFMLPAFFVFLDSMPLSPNGKIDRRRLPAPDAGAAGPSDRTAPRTPTEETLHEIWTHLLGVSEIGVEDSFFELGGHSLLAIQLRSRIQSAFGVEIPLRTLFSTTTIESLARHVEALIIADIEAMSEAQAQHLNAQYAD